MRPPPLTPPPYTFPPLTPPPYTFPPLTPPPYTFPPPDGGPVENPSGCYMLSKYPSASLSFRVQLGAPRRVESNVDDYTPDGVSVSIPAKDGRNFINIWQEQTNLRSVASSPYYENHRVSKNDWVRGLFSYNEPRLEGLIGGRAGSFWLTFMKRSPINPNKIIGILHCESHLVGPAGNTYKCMARSESLDEGVTWSRPELIAYNPNQFVQFPDHHYGTGDPCGFYDCRNKRYLCWFFNSSIDDINSGRGGNGVMQSTDPEGRAGTWYFYKNGSFSSPALNGSYDTLPGLNSGNPSVIWCTELNCLLMVEGRWGAENEFTFHTSTDGVQWGNTQTVRIEQARQNQNESGIGDAPMYPSFVGDGGTEWMGNTGRIYYASYMRTSEGRREMWSRDVTISRA